MSGVNAFGRARPDGVTRVATVNVNGIRAAARKGMGSWLTAADPDVLLLQEVRAPAQVVDTLLNDGSDRVWDVRVAESVLAGRAGVAIAVRCSGNGTVALQEVRTNAVSPRVAEDTGRWIEADFLGAQGQQFTFVSAYLHSGEVGTVKLDNKLAHLAAVTDRLTELQKNAESDGRNVIFGGDFNVVRSPLDIKNWKPNHNRRSGVLDEEIAFLKNWFTSGWRDVTRDYFGPHPGPYTWWSWRGKAFDNDAGWRIDYQVTTPSVTVVSVRVDRAPAYDQRFSDHAPLVVDYLL
ncbi:MAG: exodeoxyribonuclease III [Varibaculum sp.]|nr:exodeoxyribonuclease III [Varibaculum sp.]